MANVSGWKDFEKQVATALGGKRRFRTTEDYGKEADDVLFPRKVRRAYPKVRSVAIECKKRKGTLNIHAFFSEAKIKYCQDGKNLIFASKITRKGSLGADIDDYINRIVRLYCKKHKIKLSNYDEKEQRRIRMKVLKKFRDKIQTRVCQLRASHDISALVTVELGFFQQLWNAWRGIKRFPRESKNVEARKEAQAQAS